MRRELKAKLYSWSEVDEEWSGNFSRRMISGEKESMIKVFFKKGALVAPHSHPHEQISYVLKGTVKFTVEGKDYLIKEEGVLHIPSNLKHSAEALQESVAIEIFSPPRTDLMKNR